MTNPQTNGLKKGGGCRRSFFIAGGVLFGFFFLAVICAGLWTGTGQQAAARPTASTQGLLTATPTPEPTVTAMPPSLPVVGQDVVLGSIRWKVLGFIDAGQTLTSNNQFTDPKTTSGRFIRVGFEVE